MGIAIGATLFAVLRANRARGLHLPMTAVFPQVARLLEVGVVFYGFHRSLLLVHSELMRCGFGFGFHMGSRGKSVGVTWLGY